MNPNTQNPIASGSVPGSVEETLRLIASLPAPQGLEDRVQAALHSAPRTARILDWPAALGPQSAWLRAAAAAAIVFVVAGGGWGVYSHVQQGHPARVIVQPAPGPAAGGFSGAGAMRTPQTLNGPVVVRPAIAQPAKARPSKKPKARSAPGAARPAQPAAVNKTAAQPADQPAEPAAK
jgi:hypothetical protein